MFSTPEGPDQAPAAGSTSWRVRPAQWRDWPALSAMVRRLCPQLDEAELGHRLRNELHRYAVALGPRGLAGFVCLEVQPGRRVTRIDWLAVDPGLRGQGVAQALLAHADEAACACATSRLEVVLTEMEDAGMRDCLRYCLRHGFVAVAAPAQAAGLCLAREVTPRAWPRWELRRCHAPRVPPAVLQRALSHALYRSWVRPQPLPPRQTAGAQPPAPGQRLWDAVSRPGAASTADA